MYADYLERDGRTPKGWFSINFDNTPEEREIVREIAEAVRRHALAEIAGNNFGEAEKWLDMLKRLHEALVEADEADQPENDG